MNGRHSISESRDWARIILMAGLALSFVILALKGELGGAALTGAIGALAWVRG